MTDDRKGTAIPTKQRVAELEADLHDAREALNSIHAALCFSSRDWSRENRDAWIYGIVCGWDDKSFVELVADIGWKPEAVERLKRLHAGVRKVLR